MKIDNDLSKILIVFLALITSTLPCCTPTNEDVSITPQVHLGTPTWGTGYGVVPRTDSEAEITGGAPPLVVNTSTPLLLEEPTEKEEASAVATTRALVENTACFVCHANYKTEFLADRHARSDIGCVNCHGQSYAHRNDENNTTVPDTIYSADKIDTFCRSCHKAHDVSPKKVVARWAKRSKDKINLSRIVCTDCHGDHRMKVRTVIWDKKSGKLLRTNRGG